MHCHQHPLAFHLLLAQRARIAVARIEKERVREMKKEHLGSADADYLTVDLAAQAQGSRFRQQYCPGAAAWLCRPAELPATDLTWAFEPQ